MLSKIPEKYVRLAFGLLAIAGFILLSGLLLNGSSGFRLKNCLHDPTACLIEWLYRVGPILFWSAVGYGVFTALQLLKGKTRQQVYLTVPSRRSQRSKTTFDPQLEDFQEDSAANQQTRFEPFPDDAEEQAQIEQLHRGSLADDRSPAAYAEWTDPEDDRTQLELMNPRPENGAAAFHIESGFDHAQFTAKARGNAILIEVLHYRIGKMQERTLTSETLNQGGGLIGRHRNCDIVLNSPEVSRVHGRIVYLSERFYFTDLGSTAGSQVNQTKVETNQNVLLYPNDIIRIGRFSLLVKEIELRGDVPMQLAEEDADSLGDSAQPDGDLTQTRRLIFKAEELKAQGILNHSTSELVFQGRRLIEGVTLSKRLHQQAMDLWQAEVDAGRFCLLVEYPDHFTLWQDEQEISVSDAE